MSKGDGYLTRNIWKYLTGNGKNFGNTYCSKIDPSQFREAPRKKLDVQSGFCRMGGGVETPCEMECVKVRILFGQLVLHNR